MQGQNQSYLDLSVLKELRKDVLSHNAVVLFSEQIDQIIWANAGGAKLFGGNGVLDLLSANISSSQSIVRQLKQSITQMDGKKSITRGFRLNKSGKSLLIQFEIKRIAIYGDEYGYKVTNHYNGHKKHSESRLAEKTVLSLASFADAAAILDDNGHPIAATENFKGLGPSESVLSSLIKKLRREDDRLIKRPDTNNAGNEIAIGLGRISNHPGRNLIVLALTQEAETEEALANLSDVEAEEDNADPIPSSELKEEFEEEETTQTVISDIARELEITDPGPESQQSLDLPISESQESDETEISENHSDEVFNQGLNDRLQKALDESKREEDTTSYKYELEGNDGTVRFAWVIDENKVFKSVSKELEETIGSNAAAIIGREWREVANVFGFDTSREIETLLNKQDTWSGKTVLWPVEGTDMVFPIDLAALPAFNSEKVFEGFRGFGIIRTADALVDPDETGLALVSPQQPSFENDPYYSETSSLSEDTPSDEPAENSIQGNDGMGEPSADKSNIVRLVPREPQNTVSGLSEQESNAFRKIGDTLREQNEGALSPSEKREQLERAFSSNADPEPDFILELEDAPEMDIVLELEDPSEIDREEYDVNVDAELFDNRGEFTTQEAEVTASQETIAAFDNALQDEGTGLNGPVIDTSIMENLPVAIVIYNSENILFCNQSLLEMTGYENLRELEKVGGIEAILSPLSTPQENTPNKYYLTTKTGEQVRVNPILKSVPWQGEKALLISFSSSTETVIAEPPAIDMTSVSEIQNILDITSDGILVLDPEGKIVSINASAEALFNIGFDDAKNQNITTLFATESRNTIRQYVESQTEPGINNIYDDGQEVVATETNGGMIPVFITISKMQSSGKLCAVIRDMTSWKKAEEELIQSRHEAEVISNQKTDFLAEISHEIRTPLNSIIGFSDIMIEERFGPIKNERYREYLRDINRSGNHVLELINDLLDLSKIESGKLELEFEAVDLNEMVANTVAILQPQANENRIIIRTSLSRSVPKVVADVRSIRQIILNLVSNAIKFSPTNSQVIVSTVYESNGEVAMRIRDTGLGMSREQIEDALKPFHQVHKLNQDRNEGSGLGLPLTKALVEANRALFDLESEPNQGTIAHVLFPTQRVLAD
jgi:PAS domain S-box-containing protein